MDNGGLHSRGACCYRTAGPCIGVSNGARRMCGRDSTTHDSPVALDRGCGAHASRLEAYCNHLVPHLMARHGRGGGGDSQHGLRLGHVVAEYAKGNARPEVLHVLGHLVEEHEEGNETLHGVKARLVELLQQLLLGHQLGQVIRPTSTDHPSAVERLLDGLNLQELERRFEGLHAPRLVAQLVASCGAVSKHLVEGRTNRIGRHARQCTDYLGPARHGRAATPSFSAPPNDAPWWVLLWGRHLRNWRLLVRIHGGGGKRQRIQRRGDDSLCHARHRW
mmetsp:Transcript_13925/g.36983  ORF Transcript_13925/g.36983 Transcript_13925/m.36983 type:complete len:277 (-) Transcript_13925:745-1575(-)